MQWRMTYLSLSVCAVLFSWVACGSDGGEAVTDPTFEWKLEAYDEGTDISRATVTVSGIGNLVDGNDWILHFNQLILPSKISNGDLKLDRVAGDFLQIKPTEAYRSEKSGNLKFELEYNGFAGRISYAPAGPYLVSGQYVQELNCALDWPVYEGQYVTKMKQRANKERYGKNTIPDPQANNFVTPTPRTLEFLRQDNLMRGRIAIGYEEGLEFEAKNLESILLRAFTGEVVRREDAQDTHIRLAIDPSLGEVEGAYVLHVKDGVVEITGRDQAGVFYGCQTLERLIDLEDFARPDEQLKIKAVHIEDEPRFGYRGLHLDVSRNYHSIDRVKRVVDQIARFKLNKLHLTLTNDEGWRIEIPGLPELTTVGSRRGHTPDESDMLYPAYGSGPMPGPQGSGYYSRDEFIALLVYAAQRHVEIIPEIDLPGHARAAIRAMESRNSALSAQGMDQESEGAAINYLLSDPDDSSDYNSAQNYDDNVICVCRESTYAFVEKVVEELVAMYQEAGVKLSVIHSGGDEIPYGAWMKSPLCNDLIDRDPELTGVDDLHAYFMRRFIEILDRYDITAGGWEEIVLVTGEDGHNSTNINSDFLGEPVLPYVWNSVWGWGREDMAYRLANRGYDIVMCNSGALYFDLAYNEDPQEPGLTWSGFVNTESAFSFAPLDMFATATVDRNGTPLRPDYVASKESLTDEAHSRVRGIQGQLWSETVRESEMLDYYLFPKLIGLAERAWAEAPAWVEGKDIGARKVGLKYDWGRFRNTVGSVELPLLSYMEDPVRYRIPLPAARVRNGILEVNTTYPGLDLRYTTDGSEPTLEDNSVTMRVRLESRTQIKVRAFDRTGRGGRVFTLEPTSPSYQK